MADDQIRTARGYAPGGLERAERSRRARLPGDAATYLALLLLLTPLLGAVRLLVGREPPAVAAMTQVVEVPRLVYIEMPAPPVAPTLAPLEPTVRPTAEPVVLAPEPLHVLDSPEPELEPAPTVVVAAPTSVPRIAAAAVAPAPPRAAASAGGVVLYVVAPGDTLFSLARRHGTSVETI